MCKEETIDDSLKPTRQTPEIDLKDVYVVLYRAYLRAHVQKKKEQTLKQGEKP